MFDRLEDLENRSRRDNLRILNVADDNEKGQSTVKFVSNMLMEVMPGVFDKPPELERARLVKSHNKNSHPGRLWSVFTGFRRRKKHYGGPG